MSTSNPLTSGEGLGVTNSKGDNRKTQDKESALMSRGIRVGEVTAITPSASGSSRLIFERAELNPFLYSSTSYPFDTRWVGLLQKLD